jgi:hypothetical protein
MFLRLVQQLRGTMPRPRRDGIRRPRLEDMTPEQEQEQEILPPVPTSTQVPPAILFSDNSPLHAIPGNLHIAQMVVLDGISTSIDAISIAYRHLQAQLLEFNRAMDQHKPPSRTLTVPAVMNAWNVIDAAHRLRLLVPTLRGLKHGSAVTSLRKSLEPVEPFRHVVQHLDQQIPRLSPTASRCGAACPGLMSSPARSAQSGSGCSCPAPPGRRWSCHW